MNSVVTRRAHELIRGMLLVIAVGAFASPVMAKAIALIRFPVATASSVPSGIAAGPDGNLWFTENQAGKIGRITLVGQVTEFLIPTPGADPFDIVAGADGNLWFTEVFGNRIGRITPAGVITEFAIPTPSSGPRLIATGPDGNVWFTESDVGQIGQITPTGVITEFPIPTPNSAPFGITAGPDGNLWFTELAGNKIGRITPAGVITEFPLPAERRDPHTITGGPDGNLWFTETLSPQIVGATSIAALGRITPDGVITEFPIPTIGTALNRIVAGPDGALWFTETNQFGRMTPTGQFTTFPHPVRGSNPLAITVGPDGNLWFAETNGNAIGRLSITSVLGLSPPSGVYVTTQRFDPTVILAPGVDVTEGSATFNAADVTDSLAICGVPGTLVAGGTTFRCSGVTGGALGPGTHAFAVILALADGSNLVGGATWQVFENREP